MARQATVGQSQSNAPIPIRVVEADLKLPEHKTAELAMVDAYSRDSMGKAKPLDADVRARLILGLQKHPTTLVILSYAGEQAVGAASCFIGLSTCAATQRINI